MRLEGTKAGVQLLRKEFHTYINLDYIKVEFLFCLKKSTKTEKVTIQTYMHTSNLFIYIYIYIYILW